MCVHHYHSLSTLCKFKKSKQKEAQKNGASAFGQLIEQLTGGQHQLTKIHRNRGDCGIVWPINPLIARAS